MMVVLDADRFGISQLHQLRGRVGRGSVPGLALLVTGAAADSIARQRVEAVASTLDGFALAQADLELRHEGDVLGSSQSGFRSSLKLLSVIDDVDTIVTAAQLARRIVAADPSLAEHMALRAAIARRLDESTRDFLVKG
jgi:ATP-dependent DNA helicase RecG